ncbi:hypothetical protein [Sphingomonas sp.]|uniref:hypothetical protein n=1 Tax=Sphingomonas sp. TaxID=28214 RepID=UPI0025D881D1|nr:hypothetical protein [Sphingomonas sp.]
MKGHGGRLDHKSHGVPCIGVAASPAQRVQQHREGKGSKFRARYNFKPEHHDMIDDAIRREKLAQGVEARMEVRVDRALQSRMARSVRRHSGMEPPEIPGFRRDTIFV